MLFVPTRTLYTQAMSETLNIVGEILAIETIAEGHGIRELAQLRLRYGYGCGVRKKGLHWWNYPMAQ